MLFAHTNENREIAFNFALTHTHAHTHPGNVSEMHTKEVPSVASYVVAALFMRVYAL